MGFIKITINSNQHKECQIRSQKVATNKGKQKLYQNPHPPYIKNPQPTSFHHLPLLAHNSETATSRTNTTINNL